MAMSETELVNGSTYTIKVEGDVLAVKFNYDVPVTMTSAEWDAFVAAGNAALGRPLTPLADRIATEQCPPVDLSGICSEGREEEVYGEGYAKGRADAAAMVREAGPTVPRAAVEALRDTILGWEKAALPGSYEDGRAQGLLDVVAVIDTMLGTPTPTEGR